MSEHLFHEAELGKKSSKPMLMGTAGSQPTRNRKRKGERGRLISN